MSLCGNCLGCSFCEEKDVTFYEIEYEQRRVDALRANGQPTLSVKFAIFFNKDKASK